MSARGLASSLQQPGTMARSTRRTRPLRYHFSGVAGAGMSPLAALMRLRGHAVQGSDRSLDQGKSTEIAASLRALGVELYPHDGAAVTAAVDRFVHSTAVEASTPEMRAAEALGLRRTTRPALLAEIVAAGRPGVAIAGTSGKSTITGMLAWLLREARVPATVIGGAALVGEGRGGCLVAGPAGAAVVAEACESDGTLVGYRPAVGVIHNISRDHAELASLRAQFATFAAGCQALFVNAASSEAVALGVRGKTLAYGVGPEADAPLVVERVGPERALGTLRVEGRAITLDVPQPGLHNLENAAAAALVALRLGLTIPTIERLVARFPGVGRRFEVIGVTPSGIRVVDDYAHNADKLRAAITTAQAGAARLVAVFQPHGFGPARFLRPELCELLPRVLRPDDRFCYAEIYYAGGTVARDISSEMLAEDLRASRDCAVARDHDAVQRWVTHEARPGDTVLVMGARDPDLPALSRAIFAALSHTRPLLV
ncbi:MAG TPA: Mur ligase domain-containing protein [Solirubrobacter sp.]|nr:Mur ligase domain-containing protein [Solirubrobacter sp.]